MNHAPSAGSLARHVDQQSSTLPPELRMPPQWCSWVLLFGLLAANNVPAVLGHFLDNGGAVQTGERLPDAVLRAQVEADVRGGHLSLATVRAAVRVDAAVLLVHVVCHAAQAACTVTTRLAPELLCARVVCVAALGLQANINHALSTTMIGRRVF